MIPVHSKLAQRATRDRTDWPAMIAALQIRLDHHAEALTKLIGIVEDLSIRLELRDQDRGS